MTDTKKKPTKREVITQMLEDSSIRDNELYVSYLKNELELLDKKSNSSKKTSIENLKLKEILLTELAKIGKPITITEFINSSEVIKNYILENGNPLSNQKISSLFTTMFKVDKTINRVVDKKKTYFSIIEE